MEKNELLDQLESLGYNKDIPEIEIDFEIEIG